MKAIFEYILVTSTAFFACYYIFKSFPLSEFTNNAVDIEFFGINIIVYGITATIIALWKISEHVFNKIKSKEKDGDKPDPPPTPPTTNNTEQTINHVYNIDNSVKIFYIQVNPDKSDEDAVLESFSELSILVLEIMVRYFCGLGLISPFYTIPIEINYNSLGLIGFGNTFATDNKFLYYVHDDNIEPFNRRSSVFEDCRIIDSRLLEDKFVRKRPPRFSEVVLVSNDNTILTNMISNTLEIGDCKSEDSSFVFAKRYRLLNCYEKIRKFLNSLQSVPINYELAYSKQ